MLASTMFTMRRDDKTGRTDRPSNRGLGVTALAVALSFTMVSAAQAASFVRPVLIYEGEFVDGYAPNTTQGSLTFSDSFRSLESHVDLSDGTIKTYLQVNGPGSSFGIAAGVLGERIRYTGPSDVAANFSFAFDGQIDATQMETFPGSAEGRNVSIAAYLAVYDASVGATYLNWAFFDSNASQALLNQYVPLDFTFDTENFSQFVFNTDLGGSLNLVSGNSYDVFASFNVIARPGDNIGPITMNFLNTGTIGITAPDGGSFTSQSGSFLGFAATPGVPEPSQWLMLIAGFGLVGAITRSKRQSLGHGTEPRNFGLVPAVV